jgi:protein kinase-like protein
MLLERVRRAVAPDYEILAEIAGGGMGLVFAARQARLDRKVAIKILRPEHATAIAVERFLAEGRLLARLAHPNIVPVYDAGEADGLLYYVMEYVEGETLAERLTDGALSHEAAISVARDLLGALGAAHAMGVVHRDVKPANVFLRDGRALLGDFGIARWREEQGEHAFTTPGELIGTPRYMAPEQRDGLPATTRTDVYAAGLVIWETCTGVRWPFYQNPREADWSKLPPALAAPVRKALELEPAARWADARAFAAVMAQRPRRRRTPLVLAATGAAALIAWAVWPRTPQEPERGFPIELGRIALQGEASPAERGLGDSAAVYLRKALDFPDFYLPPAGQRLRDPRTLRLAGTAQVSGGRLQLVVEEAGAPQAGRRIQVSKSGAAGAWQSVVDSLASELVYEVWLRAASDKFFPDEAIPQNPLGRAQLARAEQLFSLGRWDEATVAYHDVQGGCLLCAYRSLDIARWFGEPPDPEQLTLLQASFAKFPSHYQSLIRATALVGRERLDALASAASTYPGFFLASFEYGDELFHRGPLFGRLRAEAVPVFQNVILDRPAFQPGLEHLAWAFIATGDSAGAARELAALQRLPRVSGLSGALTLLRSLGFHWRFLPGDTARHYSETLLGLPEVRQNRDAPAAARLLMSMDAPQGAVELGGMLAHWPGRSDAVRSGLLGRLYGFAALGRLDSVRAMGRRFASQITDPAYALLALELEAALRGFDPDPAVRDAGSLRDALRAQVRQLAADPLLRRRASWALGLLAAENGDTAALALAQSQLRDEPEPAPLRSILEAAVLGRKDARRGLLALPSIPPLDQEIEYSDPLEDAVVRLLKADWLRREDSLSQASRTLRWHEHTQISGHLNGLPQAGELAWALGTLAQWKRAGLLSEMDDRGAEWCSVNRSVARLWAGGDASFRVRAESAQKALASPACAAAP